MNNSRVPWPEHLKTLSVSSEAFTHQGKIPRKYTCDGKDVNPPLKIEHIPENTRSLVLIMDDPDAPAGDWVHWLVWNIHPEGIIRENTVPGIEGMNDFNKQVYKGPCPPKGTHRYFFKVYALDTELDLEISCKKADLENALLPHLIAYGEMTGLYKKALWF